MGSVISQQLPREEEEEVNKRPIQKANSSTNRFGKTNVAFLYINSSSFQNTFGVIYFVDGAGKVFGLKNRYAFLINELSPVDLH